MSIRVGTRSCPESGINPAVHSFSYLFAHSYLPIHSRPAISASPSPSPSPSPTPRATPRASATARLNRVADPPLADYCRADDIRHAAWSRRRCCSGPLIEPCASRPVPIRSLRSSGLVMAATTIHRLDWFGRPPGDERTDEICAVFVGRSSQQLFDLFDFPRHHRERHGVTCKVRAFFRDP